ncbi:unnamed protein product [Rotaria sordida]|uniref:Uncharacterized protein n=1 Tax=Rotaria sordida TaxID=392033 RepID=A0A814ARK9_9BILA|nr:unnamed protein product [Rotaria sordida]CAF0962312.1 unnamed protein product [Rotaria sordida]CAF1370524.1 unnamed protein product [Rotaria sordida]CAF3850257.1 unnamed protein product [Rotaria sordida]
MGDQRHRYVTNLDNVNLLENNPTNILDDEFKNSMEIFIAECIGTISKNYLYEYQRLAVFTFYPPLRHQQIRELAIENLTSSDAQHQIAEKVYKQLELIFQNRTIKWNSIAQTTAKRFVRNSVQQAVEIIRKKLLRSIDHEYPKRNIVIQRFILDHNRLKLV